MPGAHLQETGAGRERRAPAADPHEDFDESTEHQFDAEFAVGTVIDERPHGPFAELDARLRELNEQLARLRQRIGLMSPP